MKPIYYVLIFAALVGLFFGLRRRPVPEEYQEHFQRVKEFSGSLSLAFLPKKSCGLALLDQVEMDTRISKSDRWLISLESFKGDEGALKQTKVLTGAELLSGFRWNIELPKTETLLGLYLCKDRGRANSCIPKDMNVPAQAMVQFLESSALNSQWETPDLVYFAGLLRVGAKGEISFAKASLFSDEVFPNFLQKVVGGIEEGLRPRVAEGWFWLQRATRTLGAFEFSVKSETLEFAFGRYSPNSCPVSPTGESH